MIETILQRATTLPEQTRLAFEQIFYVNVTDGHAIPPAPMEEWVVRQFGAVADVREQTIVNVTNRLTLESALFNGLRARRPSPKGGGDAALEQWIARELAEHDIFRDPLRDTTEDVFGRIRGAYCVTASNVAKYDGWHGVVIFDEPHPLHFGPAQVRDYLDTALRWLYAAHAHDAQAIYPIITWNCLPKSGATIMHGHMQIALARGMHYAAIERWRRAAELYRAHSGRSYFADLFAIHQELGLAIPTGGETRAFAHLTPARNREIVLLHQQPLYGGSSVSTHSGAADTEADTEEPPYKAFAETIGAILRRLIDDHGMRAFNLALALLPLGPTAEDWSDTPIVARIADRGDALSNRSDIGAMELFASGCIVADPFVIAAALKSS